MAAPVVSQPGPYRGPYRPSARTDVGSEFNAWRNATVSLYTVLILTMLAAPGAALGVVLAWAVWKLTRPTWLTIIVLSLGSLVAFVVFSPAVLWWWPWGLFLPERLFHTLPVGSAMPYGSAVELSCVIELQLGPACLIVLQGLLVISERTLTAGIFRQAREGGEGREGGSRVRDLLSQYASVVAPLPAIGFVDLRHPAGGIRLAADKDNRKKPFDLAVSELAQHVFIPGASGSGKTTTLARLADGVMASGWGVVIVDCKGGGLGGIAKKLAASHSVPYLVVDPEDPATVGYNPATGDAADVTNKLIGAFSYGENGEIYKQIAMSTVPIIVKGLMAAGKPVTLATIADACDTNALAQLGYDAGPPLQDILVKLASADGVGKAGLDSLQYRFGALQNGKFGKLFDMTPALDWDAALAKQSVIYVALPATAASEDVELMGRVIAQDLKQVCGRRLRALANGGTVQPALIAFDEFAALREAGQITDLLLQARQAAMAVVLSTQFLPQDVPIRKAALSAGLLVAHRLESQDAEDVAGQFGTHKTWKVTQQIDWESGTSQKGSVRDVDEYNVHPNSLRTFPTGTAAIRSVTTDRTAIVNVIPPT
jgi:hypothetical protein